MGREEGEPRRSRHLRLTPFSERSTFNRDAVSDIVRASRIAGSISLSLSLSLSRAHHLPDRSCPSDVLSAARRRDEKAQPCAALRLKSRGNRGRMQIIAYSRSANGAWREFAGRGGERERRCALGTVIGARGRLDDEHGMRREGEGR